MFDTYVRKSYGGPSEIKINRAPTDESAEMLREYEREAEKRVLDLLRPSTDNVVSFTIAELEDNPLTGDSRLIAMFTVNGRKFHKTLPIDRVHLRDDTAVCMRAAYEALSQQIAMMLLEAATPGLRHRGMR